MFRNFVRPTGKSSNRIVVESEAFSPAKKDLELIVEIGRRIEVDSEEVRT